MQLVDDDGKETEPRCWYANIEGTTAECEGEMMLFETYPEILVWTCEKHGENL